MAETASPTEGEKRRERPTHWAHPVDERRRQARARSHRRRRVLLLAAVLAVVSLVAAYAYLTSDKRVEQYAEAYLEDLLGVDVRIGHATFSLGEGLMLENLRILPPEPFKEALLSAERVDLRVDPLSVLLLAPDVKEIVVHRPTINLVLWDEQRWNFQALRRIRPLEAARILRPVVALDQGRLCVERKIAGETVYQHQMDVSGLLLPSETESGTFRFQTDVKSQTVHLAVASGVIDARTGSLRFEGQASNVALTPDLYRTLPREAQRIWDRFEPTGSVNLKLVFDEKAGFCLVTDLTGVAFVREHKGLKYRFENLTGRCAFSRTGLTLTGMQGLVNGTPVRLEGEVTGFDEQRLGLALKVQADHVDFEASREALVALAPAVEPVYETYAPKGQFDAAMTVRRESGQESRIEVDGTIACREVEATYAGFPYRLDRLRGTLRFGPEGFQTEGDGVEGYHGTAVVRLSGWGKNPGRRMETQMHVQARNLALDDDLRAALAPWQRRIYDQYAPSGLADAEADIYRPPEEGAELQSLVQLTLRDCRFKYEGFPYLLTQTTGQVNIQAKRTEIVNVRGRHGRATITLAGEILTTDAPDRPQVNLKVVGQDVPLDEDLEAALPERDRAALKTFHLSGTADIEGTITAGPQTQGGLEYDLAVDLKGARMIYEPFPLLAEQMTGQLHLAKGACRIDSITGYYSGARIQARGWIEQRPDDYAMELMLDGTDVMLNESLRGALGPEIRSVWSHLAPRGRVDVNAHLVKALGPQEFVKHHVWVTARKAQARLDVFPYPLEDVTGQLEFEGNEVQLHNVKARSGLTEFALDGRIAHGPLGPELDLKLQTRGLRLEGPLREALPAPLKKAFEILRPTGRLDLNLTRLSYRPTGPGAAEAVWTAQALLDEVGAEPGLKVSGLVGTAELAGRWVNGQVALDGCLHVQQGKVGDKEISETRLRIEKPLDSATVSLRGIEGEFYGGRMEGFADIRLEPSTRYAMNLSATDVDFERLLREGWRIERNLSGGRLKATLGLRARGPEAQQVEASGYVDVTDAHLYELPLVVRVFNVLRLAPGDPTAFEKARVLYFVRGPTVYLGDIRLEGRATSLYGAGFVESGGQLNLTFLAGKKNDDPLVPALAELAEGLRKELVVVLVTGTVSEPQVQTRSLSSLGAPFRELLRLVREQREREAAASRR